MKVNWDNEKEALEKLIKEGVSYERIGRQYGVTGASVKKAARKMGIELEKKREINPNEHFNKGAGKVHICQNCGSEFKHKGTSHNIFCSCKCHAEYKRNKLIESWKRGDYKGSPEYISDTIKNYLLEKNNYKCELCGFEGYNVLTKNTILQIHHKDGDSSNNSEDNLQVLCPNCHAMTDTYANCGKRKSSRTRYDSKTYYLDKFKKEFGVT